MERRSVWLFFVIKCDVGTVPPEDQLHVDRQTLPMRMTGSKASLPTLGSCPECKLMQMSRRDLPASARIAAHIASLLYRPLG